MFGIAVTWFGIGLGFIGTFVTAFGCGVIAVIWLKARLLKNPEAVHVIAQQTTALHAAQAAKCKACAGVPNHECTCSLSPNPHIHTHVGEVVDLPRGGTVQ